ncbi:MAG: BCCT family transporter [Oscillospiraceae bacterium]|nr:BCCT family transporter [Oscillospiraceae bacterium]
MDKLPTNSKPSGMRIDKAVFLPATIVTLALGILFFAAPAASNDVLSIVHAFTTNELGWFFLAFTAILLCICFYYGFSRMGNIVLGAPGEKPMFSTFTWLGLVLVSGTGGSLLYLSSIEWIWIAAAPPFGVDPMSVDAFRWASTYGMYHWGPSAWAFYIAVSVPIAYFFYVKKKNNMKMSEYCRPLLGKHADGIAGHGLNFLYIFGLLGGVLTSLALGTPPLASGIAFALGLSESNLFIDTMVIALWTFLPLIAIYLGMKKGIARASQLNIYGFVVLLLLILVFGPTWFILNQSLDSLGLMIQNYIYMGFATDPIGAIMNPDGHSFFPQAWTIFYMSWWAVYALPFGLFIAKISKGRTIRQLALGGLASGSLGSMIFYMVMPNYGIHLQLTGAVDLAASLAERGRGGVVIDMMMHAPAGPLMVVLFTLVVLISYVTGHVTVGYSLAAASEKRIKGEQDPQLWNVTFWLILAGIVSLGLYLINPDALTPLQTVSILAGFPICFAIAVLVMSFFKQLKKDFPDGVPAPSTSNGGKIYGEPEQLDE